MIDRADRFTWDKGDLDLVEIVERGGPGSGHFEHEGRPGEVGGSLPGWAGKKSVEIEGLTVVTGKFILNENLWAVVGEDGKMASRWKESPEKAVEDFRATSEMREEAAKETKKHKKVLDQFISHYQSTGEIDKELLSKLERKKWVKESYAVGFLRDEFGLRWTDANKIVKKSPGVAITSAGAKMVDVEQITRQALAQFPPRLTVKGILRRIFIRRDPGVERHIDHLGQEGRPGEVGGSQPGYEHTGGKAGTVQVPGQPDTTPESGLSIPTKIEFDENLPNEARAEGLYDRIVVGPKFNELPSDTSKRHVLAHEIGHTISDAMLADGSGWRLQDEGAFIGDFDGREVEGISGQYKPGENLAEAYATFITEPEWLQEHYPAAYEGIRDAVDRYGFPSSLEDALGPLAEQMETLGIAPAPEPESVKVPSIPSEVGEVVGIQNRLSLHEGPNYYDDEEGAHEWGQENFPESYPPEQFDNLYLYKTTNYDGINRTLRMGADDPELFKEEIHYLDTVMAENETPEDIVAYRGMNIEHIIEQGNDVVGKTFQDMGYTSTSLSSRDAEEFAVLKENGILARIFIPAGTHSTYMDFPQMRDEVGFGIEEELLLARGTRFKVMAYRDVEGGKKEIDLEVLS